MFYFAKLLQQNWRNEYTLVTSFGNMESVVCDVVSPEDGSLGKLYSLLHGFVGDLT
jgi:hypothetical protein